MDAVVVYKANPESLQIVLGLLRKEGFNPMTLENPGSADTLHGGGRATYLVSIAVPRDQALGAKSVLRRWDKARQSDVDQMTGKLAGPLIFSIIASGVLALILFLSGVLWDAVPVLFVAWITFFALAANTDRIKLKLRGFKGR